MSDQDQKVSALIAEFATIPWFSRVGQPSPWDGDADRVGLDFLVSTNGVVNGAETDPYMHWGTTIAEAESKIERIVFDNRLMDEEVKVSRSARISGDAVDDFYEQLLENHEGYYADTCMYIYELVELPDRLIRGAALESLISEIAPHLHFFTDLLPYFRAGFWPCGWNGEYPDGRLILF